MEDLIFEEPHENPSNLKREVLPDHRKTLKNKSHKNINKMILAQLNIHSLWNKFGNPPHIINKNIDALLISETKIDSSFHSAQFHLEDYATPYKLDRNANGGGILLYIREDITSRLLNCDLSVEGFLIEIKDIPENRDSGPSRNSSKTGKPGPGTILKSEKRDP